MKVTRTVTELYGPNESPLAGDYIESSERDFVTKGVVVGVSTLYNQTNGLSALVSAVTASRIDAVGTRFSPGDFWKVSLNAAYTMQDDNGPLVEIQCKRCGWSYPRKDLIKGRCKTCVDLPQRTKQTV